MSRANNYNTKPRTEHKDTTKNENYCINTDAYTITERGASSSQ